VKQLPVIGLLVGAALLASNAASQPAPTLAKDAARMKAMALTSAEVPSDFGLVFRKLYTPAEIGMQGTWTPAQLKSWGYEGGYEVQFDRGSETSDLAQISSDIGAYKTLGGARRALAANAVHCQLGLWSELPSPTGLGDAAHLCTLQTTLRGFQVKVFFVVWTLGRFKGALTETSLASSPLGAADALALAKKQAARMRKALR
jgi:hypothetical protein